MIRTLPPLSLYIHMPWCVKKCPYCDFNSHNQPKTIPEQKYIERLCQQAHSCEHYAQKRPIESIFIGGGTPNLISPKGYNDLFTSLQKDYRWPDAIEITMEANPGAQEAHDFKDYRETGINRLSLGAQSFRDQQLEKLGRIHQASHIIECFQAARQAGFNNINIDLMYGLIEQTASEAIADLQCAIDLHPEHISWYQLTLEPNTYFAKHPPKVASTDTIIEIEQRGRLLLEKHGYHRYEVSAYAKDNKQCKHNMNYWQFGDYIGLGAGAHGKITDLKTQTISRTTHYKMPETYMMRPEIFASVKPVENSELAFEFMLNVCRLQQPITFELFEMRTGLLTAELIPILQSLKTEHLVNHDQQSFSLTALGHRYLNDVISTFL